MQRICSPLHTKKIMSGREHRSGHPHRQTNHNQIWIISQAENFHWALNRLFLNKFPFLQLNKSNLPFLLLTALNMAVRYNFWKYGRNKKPYFMVWIYILWYELYSTSSGELLTFYLKYIKVSYLLHLFQQQQMQIMQRICSLLRTKKIMSGREHRNGLQQRQNRFWTISR